MGKLPFRITRDNTEYTEFELVGFHVFVHQADVECLRGKLIVLDKGRGVAGGNILAVKDKRVAEGWGQQ
jgi:hypothetical protein